MRYFNKCAIMREKFSPMHTYGIYVDLFIKEEPDGWMPVDFCWVCFLTLESFSTVTLLSYLAGTMQLQTAIEGLVYSASSLNQSERKILTEYDSHLKIRDQVKDAGLNTIEWGFIKPKLIFF
jgi:hypothetical protein